MTDVLGIHGTEIILLHELQWFSNTRLFKSLEQPVDKIKDKLGGAH